MQHSKCCVRNVPRVRIPNSPPKREVMLWHCFSFFVWDSNKEGADLSAEENSPVDCFRRRGQGAKRREGIRQYAEKIPNSPPKWKAGRKACFCFCKTKKGFEQGGSRLVCGRKQSGGLFSPTRSRSEATRRHTLVTLFWMSREKIFHTAFPGVVVVA